MTGRSGALHEQACRRIIHHLAGAETGTLRRARQRNELEDLFAFHQQRLAAGRENG